MGSFGVFFATLLCLASIFLILLVLVQRGRGGGLTGALGGLGGQSAFGAKAGDVFTRITIVAATIWILLCMVTVKLSGSGNPLNTTRTSNAPLLPDAATSPNAGTSGAGASTEKAKPTSKLADDPVVPAGDAEPKTPAQSDDGGSNKK